MVASHISEDASDRRLAESREVDLLDRDEEEAVEGEREEEGSLGSCLPSK